MQGKQRCKQHLTGAQGVAGVRIKAWFAADIDEKESGIGGWIKKPAQVIYQHGEGLHFLRRWEVRWVDACSTLASADHMHESLYTRVFDILPFSCRDGWRTANSSHV